MVEDSYAVKFRIANADELAQKSGLTPEKLRDEADRRPTVSQLMTGKLLFYFAKACVREAGLEGVVTVVIHPSIDVGKYDWSLS